MPGVVTLCVVDLHGSCTSFWTFAQTFPNNFIVMQFVRNLSNIVMQLLSSLVGSGPDSPRVRRGWGLYDYGEGVWIRERKASCLYHLQTLWFEELLEGFEVSQGINIAQLWICIT